MQGAAGDDEFRGCGVLGLDARGARTFAARTCEAGRCQGELPRGDRNREKTWERRRAAEVVARVGDIDGEFGVVAGMTCLRSVITKLIETLQNLNKLRSD